MTAATSTWTVTTDAWSLRVMREAKAHRDANPGVSVEEQATDAYLDAYLAACEDAAAEVGTTTEREPVEAPEKPRSGAVSPSRSGSDRNAPTEGQVRFLASLARDLGYELQTPRDKSHASLIIDGAKKALAKQRAAGTAAPRPERKATERQAEFLANLLSERAHDLGDLDPAEVTAARASGLIEQLLSAPRAAVAAHGIREGRYAFEIAPGEARFYRVTRQGRIRVQAGPSEHPYNGKLNADLEWIKANPREAASLYGRLIEKCGRCGLALTDDESRARGLGPVCAGKTEW